MDLPQQVAGKLLLRFNSAYGRAAEEIAPEERDRIIAASFVRLRDFDWIRSAFISLSVLDIRRAEQAIPVLDQISAVAKARRAKVSFDSQGWDIATIVRTSSRHFGLTYHPVGPERWVLSAYPKALRWPRTALAVDPATLVMGIAGYGNWERVRALKVGLSCSPEKANEIAKVFRVLVRDILHDVLPVPVLVAIKGLLTTGETLSIDIAMNGWRLAVECGAEPPAHRESPSYKFSMLLTVDEGNKTAQPP